MKFPFYDASAAKTYYDQFVLNFPAVFLKNYLDLPSTQQLKNLLELHHNQHGVNGMIGSLDCMHCKWKKCPKAYQGAFEGAKSGPTVVLEAICDYNLYFWDAAFGFPGSLNDINVLNLSPLMTALLDGTFERMEASHVPFRIGDDVFEL